MLNLNKFSEIMIFIKEGLVCVYKVLILLRFRRENVIRNQELGIGSKYCKDERQVPLRSALSLVPY